MHTRLWLNWTICLAIVGGLFAGCGGGDTSSDAADASGGGEAEYSIAFVTNMSADFWNIARSGAEDADEENPDITVDVRFPSAATATVQQEVVQDLLARGIDGLAISPVDAENQVGFLNRAAEQVKLITHDSDAPESNRLMYIGMDNYAAGRACGELVKEALPDGGEVALFIGVLEQDNARKRRQGVIDELLDRSHNPDRFDPVDGTLSNDKYTIVVTSTDSGASDAQSNAEDVLTAYPDIDAMVGLFEYNPPAIYQALESAGKLGDVALIGFDENETTLRAIQDGYCVGTVVQNPYEYGYQSVTTLAELLRGNEDVIPENKFIDIPHRVITRDNVDQFWQELRALTSD